MRRIAVCFALVGMALSLWATSASALPNPAAAYAAKLGYDYQARADGSEVVVVAPGVELNAWDFFRGKVGNEYSYGALFGYDTINRQVEENGFIRSFAVCVPKNARRLANGSFEGEITLLELVRQNSDPLWDARASAPPAALQAALDAAPIKTFPKQELPESFDWRDVGGLSYIGAVRNQGSCGSCYAFGAAAAAEGTFNYANARTGADCLDFSEAYIAWCLGAYGDYSGDFSGCDGASYAYAELLALTVEGVCSETQMPYNGGADPGSCTYAGTTTVFDAWARVPVADVDAIKTAIMTYGVVDAAVLTDDAFMDYAGGVFDNSNNSCPDGYNTTSDHAISLVGWDDTPPEGGGGVWILRNSWGPSSWGEDGYMRLRYDAAAVHCAVCYLTYGPPPESAPVFNSISSQTATVGVAKVFAVSATGNPAPGLSLLSTTASTGYSFVATNGVLTYTPPYADIGNKTFTFKATNSVGAATQVVSVVVKEAPPAAPASLWASATNNNDFTAAWSTVTNATGYRLDVGTNATFTGATGGNTNLIAEGFASGSPSGWTISAGGTYASAPYVGTNLSGQYSIKFSTTGNSALTPTFASGATNLQFWAYGNGGAGSTFAISGLVSGVWTLLDTVSIAQNGATYNVAVNPLTTQLGFHFTKSVNCALDDVIVTKAGTLPSYMPGYENRSVAGTSQSVTGLSQGVAYYFRVRSVNSGGTGVNSSVANVTTMSSPSAPSFNPLGEQSAVVGEETSFTVSATGNPVPALSLLGTTASSGYSFTAGTGLLTYTPPEGDLGTRTFTFKATNTLGSATQVVSVAVTAGIPSAPASIWASATNATYFTAAWSASFGAESYRLDVGTNDNFSGGGAEVSGTNCYHNGTLGAGTGGTWTETGLTQGSGYLVCLSGDELATPSMDFTVCSSEALNFKARTYGGVNAANNEITVSISTNNGSNWSSLGTRTPLNSTLTDMTPFDLSAYSGTQVKVKLETLGATTSVGAGLDDVMVTSLTGGGAPTYVAGYSNRTVNGTSQNVTGLTEGVTYYFRARAVNASGTSADSSIASVVTAASGGGGGGDAAYTNYMNEYELDPADPGCVNCAASQDHDEDGIPNLDEYNMGTDPTDGNTPPFDVVDENPLTPSTCELTISPTATGRVYSVYVATNLIDANPWTLQRRFTNNAPGSEQSVVITNMVPTQLYRISVKAP